ncbi:MAG: hypothetical protein R8G34_05615 [Paracoccaceae bacterium]|nr:hypothetical protein [Paracoccaceae bacterium]
MRGENGSQYAKVVSVPLALQGRQQQSPIEVLVLECMVRKTARFPSVAPQWFQSVACPNLRISMLAFLTGARRKILEFAL